MKTQITQVMLSEYTAGVLSHLNAVVALCDALEDFINGLLVGIGRFLSLVVVSGPIAQIKYLLNRTKLLVTLVQLTVTVNFLRLKHLP